jgi:hypothetical protein
VRNLWQQCNFFKAKANNNNCDKKDQQQQKYVYKAIDVESYPYLPSHKRSSAAIESFCKNFIYKLNEEGSAHLGVSKGICLVGAHGSSKTFYIDNLLGHHFHLVHLDLNDAQGDEKKLCGLWQQLLSATTQNTTHHKPLMYVPRTITKTFRFCFHAPVLLCRYVLHDIEILKDSSLTKITRSIQAFWERRAAIHKLTAAICLELHDSIAYRKFYKDKTFSKSFRDLFGGSGGGMEWIPLRIYRSHVCELLEGIQQEQMMNPTCPESLVDAAQNNLGQCRILYEWHTLLAAAAAANDANANSGGGGPVKEAKEPEIRFKAAFADRFQLLTFLQHREYFNVPNEEELHKELGQVVNNAQLLAFILHWSIFPGPMPLKNKSKFQSLEDYIQGNKSLASFPQKKEEEKHHTPLNLFHRDLHNLTHLSALLDDYAIYSTNHSTTNDAILQRSLLWELTHLKLVAIARNNGAVMLSWFY